MKLQNWTSTNKLAIAALGVAALMGVAITAVDNVVSVPTQAVSQQDPYSREVDAFLSVVPAANQKAAIAEYWKAGLGRESDRQILESLHDDCVADGSNPDSVHHQVAIKYLCPPVLAAPAATPKPVVQPTERESFEPKETDTPHSLPGAFRGIQVNQIKPRIVTVFDPPSNVRSEPASTSGGSAIDNVVSVHRLKSQLRITASAELPDGTWFYVPSDGGWIHSSQVR